MIQQNFTISSTPSVQNDFGMSPLGPLGSLEAALQGSQSERQNAIDAALNRLTSIEQRTLAAMSRGASPSDFIILRALASASEAARQILEHEAELR